MTIKCIFDTSALLAIINNEPGSEMAQAHVLGAGMNTVNIAETVSYLVRNGYTDDTKIERIINFINPIPLDKELSIISGKMIIVTKHFGLSLGDRVCLATAKRLNIPVYTTDRQWLNIAGAIGVKVIQIRV